MKIFMILVGLCFFCAGAAYVYAPNIVLKINALMKKFFFNDAWVLYYRKKIGLACVLVSFSVIYFAFNINLPSAENDILQQQITRNTLYKAYMSFNIRNYRETIQLCTEILNRDPCNKRALELIALAYFHVGDTANSKLYGRKLLDIDPGNVKIGKIMPKPAPEPKRKK